MREIRSGKWMHLRGALSRKVMHILTRRTPGWLVSLEIQILLDTTARAFGVRPRKVGKYPPEEALRRYADFTKLCMEYGEADPGRLYEEAYRTGSMVRRVTGFTDRKDVEELVFWLYRNIHIAMSGSIPGDVTVSECCFSRCYSPEECRIMSYVDSGVTAGIAGGGRLTFTERITEGCSACRAVFSQTSEEEPEHE